MIPVTIKTSTISNCDCMELMKQYPDNHFDLAIVDPPYGIDAANNAHSNLKKLGNKNWDKNPPSKEFFEELFRVSKNQIIWGANYFYMPPCRGFIFWNKHPMPPSYAAGEYAWTSFDVNAKMFQGRTGDEVSVVDRIHPTQKPVKLYEWLLTNYAKQGDKILDTHLGSGSHAVACNNLGFELTACELDKDYFEASIDRIKREAQQERLF